MTISAHIIDDHKIKQTDDFLSNASSLKKEMAEKQTASLWVHVDDLADVFRLQDIFGLHPLDIDAVIHQNHPSKVEEYATYLFTIIDGLRTEEKGGFAEDDLYLFLGKRWIITINFYRMQLLDNLRKKIRSILSAPQKQVLSAQAICEALYYLALEEIVSTYYPTVDNIDVQLEKIEESILEKPMKSHLSQILVIRRETSFIENTFEMILRVLNQIISDQQTKLSMDCKKQIRSLYDRLSYLRGNLENQHNRIIILREAYNSSLSATLNETIRTLTVIATIVLPLTLIAGIYGMNFDFMPELEWLYGYYYALGLMAAVGISLISYFKIKKWI
ncbi:MAG: magnesium/cobalt transporter CorA [Thermoproteota archaeon]|nr:magnesium/cobalt transporter CorA [Thermoproteota archaeon]